MTEKTVEDRHREVSREDGRFRELVGPAGWARLPAAVRRRFSCRLEPGQSRLFRGAVIATRLSRLGRALAGLARVVGGPLPLADGATGPATVLVTDCPELGGQMWTRTYCRPGRFPQVINSVKRFTGPTGLEEYLGHGLIMRLTVGEEEGALVFRSVGYDLQLGRWRRTLPRWLAPGACRIEHRDDGDGQFTFLLDVRHASLGRLVHQEAAFREV